MWSAVSKVLTPCPYKAKDHCNWACGYKCEASNVWAGTIKGYSMWRTAYSYGC